jgi:hypothetical protein
MVELVEVGNSRKLPEEWEILLFWGSDFRKGEKKGRCLPLINSNLRWG